MTNNTDTQGAAMTLEKALAAFLDAMLGKNRSSATLRAYRTDVLQFLAFLKENNVAITAVGDVGKVDILEYLAALAASSLSLCPSGVPLAVLLSVGTGAWRTTAQSAALHQTPGDAELLELARQRHDAVSPASAADVCVMHEAVHWRPCGRPPVPRSLWHAPHHDHPMVR